MSGHSKWSQIKHKKRVVDQKKGQVFSKLGRELILAARGNPDPTSNYHLKAIIDKARAVNMPQENIERAIQRVTDRDQRALEELRLEAIGPGGVAIIVRAITDSRNRTLNELKISLSKLGLKIVPPGSLQWMMQSPVHLSEEDRERLEMTTETLNEHEDVQDITTNAQ